MVPCSVCENILFMFLQNSCWAGLGWAGLHGSPRRILWLRSASDGASLLRIDRLVKFQAETSVNAPFWQSGSVLEIFFLHCYAGLLFRWLVFGFFFPTWKQNCVFCCWRLNQRGSCPGILDQNLVNLFMTSHTLLMVLFSST